MLKLKLLTVLLFLSHNCKSMQLVTYLYDEKKGSRLNEYYDCLQQNLNHFLIDKIHIFYQNPPTKLDAILQNPKIKIIPIATNATFDLLFSYANHNLVGRRVIVAKPDIFFDNSLYRLNYYPMDQQFMCLTPYKLDKYKGGWQRTTNSHASWIFKAPTPVVIPQDIIIGGSCSDMIVQRIASVTPGITVTNPSLDIYSFNLHDGDVPANKPNYPSKTDNTGANYCPQVNNYPNNVVPFSNLNPFLLDWKLIQNGSKILLYARNMHPNNPNYCTPAQNPNTYRFACLSLNKHTDTHLLHDITQPIPLPDNSVDVYLSEDVFEHLDYNSVPVIINEIYRVLKPGGLFRFAMPDYRCDILANRSIKDINGKIIFDPQGGGNFVNGKVINGGHLWFPYYETTKALLKQTNFYTHGQINFLHYYNQKNKSITNLIDYSVCYVRRTPDHDGRVSKPYRAMSIVIDLIK